MNLVDEFKFKYRQGNAITRLIFINVLVFALTSLLSLIAFLFQVNSHFDVINWVALPASFSAFLFKPWTLITSMFFHSSLMHLLINMLWLFWFGQLFQQYLGNNKTYQAYFLGGILGGLLFMFSFNVFPVFANHVSSAFALGASAGVLSLVVASATLLPDYEVHLLLLGSVRLKYIALFIVLIDLISIQWDNPGGHIAHLGGAIFGYFYIRLIYSKSKVPDVLDKVFGLMDGSSSRRNLKVHYRSSSSSSTSKANSTGRPSQEEIDAILDKITRDGYDSLSKKEKEILFKAGE